MKRIVFLVLFIIPLISNAKLNIKVYFEQTTNGYEVFADNNEICVTSLKVKFKLRNLKSSENDNKVFILPANTKRISIAKLIPIKKGQYSFSYKTTYNYGNNNLINYSRDYLYSLPFQKNNSFQVYQGYNGTTSHKGKNALDFKMPIGTKITAARDGIVYKIIDSNNKTCESKECIKFNNFVIIYHPDGTFAEYVHIKKGGAKVNVGDEIKIGQIIAESGNVGYSMGPHLHFQVFMQKLGRRETIKTKFKINQGNTSLYLKEKEMYTRHY